MESVSTISGTYNTIFYPDNLADWKIKDFTITLENKKNGSTRSHRLGNYESPIPLCDCRFTLYRNGQLYVFKYEKTHLIKGRKLRTRKPRIRTLFMQWLPHHSNNTLWCFLGEVPLEETVQKYEHVVLRKVFTTLSKIQGGGFLWETIFCSNYI